tara:strand:+ start:24 stop:308 length:285 start_codon:yes stop_codon:yes gene_type:complete
MKKQSAFTLRSGNKPSVAKFMGVSPMKADLTKKPAGPRATSEKSEEQKNKERMFEKYDSQIQEVKEDIFQEKITEEAAATKIKQLEKLRDKYKS